jgi:eukaryotic-like serine/threonine-protein kinase
MRIQELKSILQLPADKFDIFYTNFIKENPRGMSIDFLNYLHQNQVISEGEYYQAKAEQEVEIEFSPSDILASQDGPIPGLELQQLIGEGAMGEIRLAKDIALKRKVALKVIKEEVASQEAQDLFIREIMITAQLEHPNIVPIYNMENSSVGNIAYSMKLIRGRTFAKIIEDCKNAYIHGQSESIMPLSERLEVFLKVCNALQYAHARGVLHRDLKPENIMIGPFGEVYVMDWGVAQVLNSGQDLEEDGGLVGTLTYISPEQAQGKLSELTPSSDQYALGLILQELVTLQKGVPNGTLVDLFKRARRGQKSPISHFSPKIKLRPEIVAIIEKATSINIKERYNTVDDLSEDIRRFLREEPVVARPDPFVDKVKRWVYRNRTLALVLFLLVLLGGLLTNLYNIHTQQQERENEKRLAEYKERALIELLMATSSQSQLIGERFLTYKGLLRGLAASAEAKLTLPSPIQTVYTNEDLVALETSPKDMTQSPRYNKRISVDHPVIKFAPNTEQDALLERSYQLASLHKDFQNVLLRSFSEEALTWSYEKKRKYILEGNSPVVWAYVSTEEGIHSAYPGKGQYEADYDPRRRPWYQETAERKENHSPKCGNPYYDGMGQGLVLPCTMALFDKDNSKQLIGVAGVEFSFVYIIESLLDLPGVDEIESFLVDEQGRIIVGSSDLKKNQNNITSASKELREFQVPEVVSKIKQGVSGSSIRPFNISGVFVLQRIPSLGWYYVVFGDEKNLLNLR